ncbi:MAG: cytochrome c peroxidase [Gammaproteobacteria bacterium]|jgi:cytochrome c peroxidase
MAKAIAVAMGSMLAATAVGQDVEVIPVFPVVTPDDARTHGLESLRTVVEREGVPLPSNLSRYVSDMQAAAQLGKALFHEQAVGSDAVQACVTCHFNAGADSRSKNQISPGLLRVENIDNQSKDDIRGFWKHTPNEDTNFDVVAGPNEDVDKYLDDGKHLLETWPFADGINTKTPSSNFDVLSSMGITLTDFNKVVPADPWDEGSAAYDPVFNVYGTNVRRVEPRNTPTMINAVFNFTNFWDGRANHKFNGVNPFGDQDITSRVYRQQGNGLSVEKVSLDNASLASQAVGPPLSNFEMSFTGRTFPDLGRKLLQMTILPLQDIDETDSLLGAYAETKDRPTYRELVEKAFKKQYWESEVCIELEQTLYPAAGNQGTVGHGKDKFIRVDPGKSCNDLGLDNVYSISEANFALFYGIAVMVYEATLVADYSAFDKWMMSSSSGEAVDGFGELEKEGLNVFVNEGKCVNCHGGPELTNASVRNAQGGRNVIEPMLMAKGPDGTPFAAIYDNGFYNIGVTPTYEDIGRGGNDPFDADDPQPLSFSRQFALEAEGIKDMPFEIIGAPIRNLQCLSTGDDPTTSECESGILGFTDPATGDTFHEVCRDLNGDSVCGTNDELLLKRVAVDGAFKTPGLRNIALTAPYFHNGAAMNLRQVVQFYNHGGIFCRNNQRDLDPDIEGLGLSEEKQNALVAFLISLTDMRTVDRKAPFDHPGYALPIDGLDIAGTSGYVSAVGARGTDRASRLDTFLGMDVFKKDRNGLDHFDPTYVFGSPDDSCSLFDDNNGGTGGNDKPKGGKGTGRGRK